MGFPHHRTQANYAGDITLGEIFHAARINQGITIEQASEYLKIRKAFLRAIEDDMFDDLPGGVYTVGFVRNYAQLLNLDQDYILKVLHHQVANFDVPFMSFDDPLVSKPKSISRVYVTLSVVISLGILLLALIMKSH